MADRRKRNKSAARARRLLILTNVALGVIVLLAVCTASLWLSGRNKDKAIKEITAKAETYEKSLKESESGKEELQKQLDEQNAYVEEWKGVYEQLAQQGETESNTSSPAQAESDSPYKEIHPDMQVTKEDLQASVSSQKTIYLTFDDGPSTHTGQVLDALDVYGMKATFFVTYTDKPELQQYYKEIVNRGHTIAVHTATHDYKTIYASVENYLEDFYKIYQMIYEQTGVKPTLFRYPGGSTSLNSREAGAAIAQEMTRRGFVYYDWNVSCGDGSNRATEESVKQSILEGVAKHQTSVVLMHDTRVPTVTVLPQVLEQLAATGAEFPSLNQNCKKVQFYDKNY